MGRDDQASLIAFAPGLGNHHPGQVGHLNLASVTRTAARHAIFRMTGFAPV
jgi:hypothetical protein